MKSIRLSILTVITATFFVACSNSSSGSKGDGTDGKPQAPSNSKSGYCGSEVVSDYNEVMHSARMAKISKSSNDYKKLKNKAKSFVDKYPELNCKAERDSDKSVDKEEFTIELAPIKDLIKALEEAGI